MVEIRTELSPLRMVLKNKQPVELMVQIRNDSDKPRLTSFDIVLGNHFGFEKQGRTNAKSKHLGELAPGERIIAYFTIYPKMSVESGEHTILLSAIEHYTSYQYILGKKTKQICLRVE
jgi:hypothetical protein